MRLLLHRLKQVIMIVILSQLTVAVFGQSLSIHTEIAAPSLANAKVEVHDNQLAHIMLPPSYHDSDERFPVLYYLHGYNGSTSEAAMFANRRLTKKMREGDIAEFIIVSINGNNIFGGSFYANSPVTGNWEDFITQDTLNYIDQNYRTIASPEGRGLSGFSMGGFSAISIGLKHPDLFGHVYALAPGLFDEQGLDNAVSQWRTEGWIKFLEGYAAAFSPQPDSDPMWDNWDANSNEVRQRWESGFGNIEEKISAYQQHPSQLLSMHVEYSQEDMFKWITQGSEYFVNQFAQTDTPLTSLVTSDQHTMGPTQGGRMISHFGAIFAQ